MFTVSWTINGETFRKVFETEREAKRAIVDLLKGTDATGISVKKSK